MRGDVAAFPPVIGSLRLNLPSNSLRGPTNQRGRTSGKSAELVPPPSRLPGIAGRAPSYSPLPLPNLRAPPSVSAGRVGSLASLVPQVFDPLTGSPEEQISLVLLWRLSRAFPAGVSSDPLSSLIPCPGLNSVLFPFSSSPFCLLPHPRPKSSFSATSSPGRAQVPRQL